MADVVSVEIKALHALIDGTKSEVETTSVISGETRVVMKRDLVPHPTNYWEQVMAGVKAAQEERHD
ncbi:MAG: hypothetical protein WAL07_11130 [Exiguobacterium chiriqhucha]